LWVVVGCERIVEDGRDDKSHTSDQHKVAADFADGLVECLVGVENSANKEAQAQAEQQIGEKGTKNGSANDSHTLRSRLLDQDHEQDNFDE
jgi:hypothetical protein